MKLSVIIPAYNEIGTIEKILGRVAAVPLDKEIVVVDDGSTDGTRQLLAGLNLPGLRVFFHEKNQGKGGAVVTGFAQAQGDILLIQDADLEYDPEDYPALVEPILSGRAQVVYGSRLLKKDNPRGSWSFYLGGLVVTLATNLIYQTWLTDEPTCYKVFTRQVIQDLTIEGKGFDWEPEITAKILRKGIKIVEVPIAYHPRPLEEGKKIRPWDGLEALWTLLRWRFGRI